MKVPFSHDFGGRAPASQYAAVFVLDSETGKTLHVIAYPSEFRLREDGTVTIYSRRHPSTNVYGLRTDSIDVLGVPVDGGKPVNTITF